MNLEDQISEKLLLDLQSRFPGVQVQELASQVGEDARNPAAVLTWRVKQAAEKYRRQFCSELNEHLWRLPSVPEPKVIADWIENHAKRPPDFQILCTRLRSWPEGKPYPPIPDDDALRDGSLAHKGWWKPGDKRGQDAPVTSSLPSPMPSQVPKFPKRPEGHDPRCTCEVCFAPYHEWAIKYGVKGCS